MENKRRIISLIIALIGIVLLVISFAPCILAAGDSPSISSGVETYDRVYATKTADYDGVKIISSQAASCIWKPDHLNDGFKTCTAIFTIDNGKAAEFPLKMLDSEFGIEITRATKGGIIWEYSTMPAITIRDIGLPGSPQFVEIDTWKDWKPMSGADLSLPQGARIGVKATFELPQYQMAQFNFTIPKSMVKLDPDVSACGNLNSDGGVYTMTADIDTTQAAPCIQITADNITFNGNGHFIYQHPASAVSPYAVVYAQGRINTTIKNMILNASSAGDIPIPIRLDKSNHTTIYNVNMTSWNYIPIYFEGLSRHINLSFSNITSNQYGLVFGTVSNASNFSYNWFYGGGAAFFEAGGVSGYMDALFYNNVVNMTTHYGGGTDIRNMTWNNTVMGNYWGKPNHAGFSDTCVDANGNGICDNTYEIYDYGWDFLPKANADFLPPTGIQILSPWNTSYPSTVTLAVTNRSTVHSFWYAINNTFTYKAPYTSPNGTLTLPENGNFNLTVYANDTTGAILYTDYVSFTKRTYDILANTYETNILETMNSLYNISIYDYTGVNTIIARLFTNGTYRGYTNLIHSGNYWNYSFYGIPSLLQGEINTTDMNNTWQVSINQSIISSTETNTTFQTTVERLRVLPCAAPMNNNTINFTIYDEDTPTTRVVSVFSSNIVAWVDSGYRNYSYTQTGRDNYGFCVFPGWASYKANISVTYSNTSYSTRNFFTFGNTYTNSSTFYNLFLLAYVNSSNTQFTVYNSKKVPVSGVIVKVLRYYPSTGVFTAIAYGLTGYDGTVTIPLKLYEYYQYIVQSNNVSIASTSSSQLQSISVPLSISPGNYVILFDYQDGLSGSCTVNNATYIISCTVNDNTNSISSATLSVKRFKAANYTQIVCTSTGSGSAMTLSCNLSAYSNVTMTYSLTSQTVDGTHALEFGTINWSTGFNYGLIGIFVTFLVVVTMFFAGMTYSPTSAVFMGSLGLLVCSLTNLIQLGWNTLFPFLLVAGIIIYKLTDD